MRHQKKDAVARCALFTFMRQIYGKKSNSPKKNDKPPEGCSGGGEGLVLIVLYVCFTQLLRKCLFYYYFCGFRALYANVYTGGEVVVGNTYTVEVVVDNGSVSVVVHGDVLYSVA